MRDDQIRLNATYRLKPEVSKTCVQTNGDPIATADVTIQRIKALPGRARRWFYDSKGNAFRATDFAKQTEAIEIEL